jgi:tRNA C32,U32 (ribose-2'-O)-methylase TrmJ
VEIKSAMETIKVDILNPKAKTILKNLADLNLIRIKKTRIKSELRDLLTRLRINQDEIPTLKVITSEVELVRKNRYEKKESNT